MRFKALLFDIDGTLVRAGAAGKLALTKALQQLFEIEAPSIDIAFGGRTDLSISRELFAKHNIPWSLSTARSFLACYATHFEQGISQYKPELLPGVRPLLETLQDEGRHSLGLLTGNIELCARLKLDHFQLWDFFGYGGFGDHHEERAGIAAHALAQAREDWGDEIRPEETLVIGDTPADIACARAIGAKVLAVGTGHVDRAYLLQHQPDFFMEDLSDYRDFAKILERKESSSDIA
jgi:phosphoglycolate phosphatase